MLVEFNFQKFLHKMFLYFCLLLQQTLIHSFIKFIENNTLNIENLIWNSFVFQKMVTKLILVCVLVTGLVKAQTEGKLSCY